MITRTNDPHHFINKATQIKTRVPIILTQWSLMPRFKRWRLAQDPGTGMVVLFGVLDNQFIAAHTAIPFSDYFDERLLLNMETEFQVQIISSANAGLRYAFVLDAGSVGVVSPVHNEIPDPTKNMDKDEFNSVDQAPHQQDNSPSIRGHTNMHQRLDKFLKATMSFQPMNDNYKQTVPDVLLMDDEEFNLQITNSENTRKGNLEMI